MHGIDQDRLGLVGRKVRIAWKVRIAKMVNITWKVRSGLLEGKHLLEGQDC